MMKEEEETDNYSLLSLPDEKCIICLTKPISNPAMLLPCSHLNYCTHCISMWLEKSERCPLCNTIVTDIVYNIFSDSQFQVIHLKNNLTNSNTIVNNPPQHIFRHFLYFSNPSNPLYAQLNSEIHKKKKFIMNMNVERRVSQFIKRELETIMKSYNVQILQSTIEKLLMKYNLDDYEIFMKELETYLKEHTNHFLHELKLFKMSNIQNLEAYDRLVTYKPLK
ncbi:hypothetical protein ABK040_008484 [Willaertia magna]